jgi:hypothetical protein
MYSSRDPDASAGGSAAPNIINPQQAQPSRQGLQILAALCYTDYRSIAYGALVAESFSMFKRHHRAAAGYVLALLALTIATQAGVAQAAPPTVFNPVVEAQNFSITQQRQAIYDTPGNQAELAADGAASTAQALTTEAADPGRFFTDDLCWNLSNGCAGDIRLNNWATNGYGLVRPVLFTARDGATLSSHVWATIGPGRSGRPQHRADHQARTRHLGRLRPAADTQHLAARPQLQGAGTRPSEPPCADPTSPIGTRAHGLTSTSSTTRRRTPGS